MSWRQNLRGYRLELGLVGGALAMSAAVVWDRGRVTTLEAEKRHHSVLDAWRVDDVSRMAFTTSGGPDIMLAAETADGGPAVLLGAPWRPDAAATC